MLSAIIGMRFVTGDGDSVREPRTGYFSQTPSASSTLTQAADVLRRQALAALNQLG
jgi:hypothetical protein